MKMIFLGAPGAGKGTQAENVSAKFGIPAISTGAIIRESIKAGTAAGAAAKAYTDAGKLLPDEAVIAILKERLKNEDCINGFILDGFPRTQRQAEALSAMGVNIDFALSIEVSDEDIIKRMSGRRICEKCGASYHVIYNPSSDGVTCDKCGTRLTTRRDDLPEVVLDRLKIYHEQTEPIKQYYEKLGKLFVVHGQEKVEDTTALTMAAIDKALAATAGTAV